jgi:ParB-like chromosome segregation protein Spo0J
MQIRDRIKELRRVRADTLRPHPRNWRTHPEAQRDALRGLLAEIGYADALLARALPDGTLELVDGHLRAETTPESEVPVLVVDLDDAETAKLLALLDPLAGLAGRDAQALRALVAEVETDNQAVRRVLEGMLAEADAALEEHRDAQGGGAAVGELFRVLVECRDESEQRAVYERLVGERFTCRVLTL